MKRIFLAILILTGISNIVSAQNSPVKVDKVLDAEKNFNKLIERKGIKEGFLSVADPDGIVFKPDAVNITTFYNGIDKQEGSLVWHPDFARISINGDFAFTAGPYTYQNGKSDTDRVYGDYVSIWRTDADRKFKLLLDLGIQHPEAETESLTDFKSPPDTAKHVGLGKDPAFSAKRIIMATDEVFNHSLSISALATYKEFLSPEGRYYFPGFEPVMGQDKIMKFIDNEGISITATTVDGGRAASNDLAYTYGKARIKKGDVVSNYNYVRIWEKDASHKWDVLLEVFSAVEND